MQIHVARNSAQLGVFAPEEIIAGLQSGRFLASDLGWRDGLPAWTPLGDWSEFRGAGVPPPSPHAMPAESGEPAPAMPSWERGSSFAHYVATIKEVALDPVRTFANLRDGGYARPISFTYWSLLPAWLCGSILYGALFGFMALAAKGQGGRNDAFMTWINDVLVIGPTHIASRMPVHASEMYAKNLFNFISPFIRDGALALDWEDEVMSGTCLTHAGEVRHAGVRQVLGL